MHEAERVDGVDDARPETIEGAADSAASPDGWAVPVVQTLPLTSGPSSTDARRRAAVTGALR